MTFAGNDQIHLLTKDRNTLYFAITLKNGTTQYGLYSPVSLSDEADKYRLNVEEISSGTLGK
ncbi:hypothetical protein MHBO_004580 [Bonamia ostreae]|uniref:Fibrinogen C-terminal domain-containing protein n=1 Tax=Bonamia ostreae TaxID=126728 RepID=A0ABV2AUJ3_9EUKA